MTSTGKPRVAVVGTGSIGSMALWRLAQRGVPAVGYEAFAPGHDRGAAGGESRIFRLAYREGPQYVPLLRRALQLWQELDGGAQQQLLYPSGFVTVGPRDEDAIVVSVEAARLHGLELEELDAAAARERVPEHPLRDGETMLYDPVGAILLPEIAVMTASLRAQAHGAVLRPYTRVLDVVEEDGRVSVVTEAGRDEFDQVILACGPWAAGLTPLKALPLQVKKITATWFPRRSPDLFVLGRTPPALRVGVPGFSCFPAVDGRSVKVIAHGAFEDIASADELPRSGSEAAVRRASAFVSEVLPGVHPDPVRAATYTDVFTPDGHPFVGRASEASPIIHATGFSGHGFKMAPAIGELIAELVIGDATSEDIGFLSPLRADAELARHAPDAAASAPPNRDLT